MTRYVHLNPVRVKGLDLGKGRSVAEALGIETPTPEMGRSDAVPVVEFLADRTRAQAVALRDVHPIRTRGMAEFICGDEDDIAYAIGDGAARARRAGKARATPRAVTCALYGFFRDGDRPRLSGKRQHHGLISGLFPSAELYAGHARASVGRESYFGIGGAPR